MTGKPTPLSGALSILAEQIPEEQSWVMQPAILNPVCREHPCLLCPRAAASRAAIPARLSRSSASGAKTSMSNELRGICWQREEQLQPAGNSQRLRGCSRTLHL